MLVRWPPNRRGWTACRTSTEATDRDTEPAATTERGTTANVRSGNARVGIQADEIGTVNIQM